MEDSESPARMVSARILWIHQIATGRLNKQGIGMYFPQSPCEFLSRSIHLWQLIAALVVVAVAMPAIAGYREDHIELFRITNPSLTTDHYLGADYETTSELIVGWNAGVNDEIAVAIIEASMPVVQVVVLAQSAADATHKQNTLSNAGVSTANIDFEIVETDTPWVGDYGPLAIHHIASGKISMVDPRTHDLRPLDDKVPTELAENRGVNVFRPSVFLPRGVVTNGWWTCLLSELDGLENLPDPDEADLVTLVEDYLGCTQVVFLPSLANAGSGNLSQALTFVDRNTILVGELPEESDCVNADRLDAIADSLGSLQDPFGSTFTVVRIPFPPDTDGVFRSYTDLVLVNGVVLVPAFPGFPTLNAEALSILQTHLPDWTQVPIDAEYLEGLEGGLGSLVAHLPLGDYSAQQTPPDLVCGDQANCQSTGCGDVTLEGLCADDTVVWCEDSQISMVECSTPCFFAQPGSHCEKSCGWSPEGYYDCVGEYDCGQTQIFIDGFETGDVTAWWTSS